MEILNNDNYKFISDYVEQKLPILKEKQKKPIILCQNNKKNSLMK